MALPRELEGKTPDEIAAYYEDKLETQKQFFNETLTSFEERPPKEVIPSSEPVVKKVTTGEFLADPAAETQKMIQQHGVSKEEFTRMTAQVQDHLVYTAKQMAKDQLQREAAKNGDTFDWDKIETVLNDVAAKTDKASLANPQMWVTMYYYNRGVIANTLRKEAVTRALAPAESSTPGAPSTELPAELTFEEETVAAGMGISAKTYREAQANMKESKLPLTMDSRSRR